MGKGAAVWSLSGAARGAVWCAHSALVQEESELSFPPKSTRAYHWAPPGLGQQPRYTDIPDFYLPSFQCVYHEAFLFSFANSWEK